MAKKNEWVYWIFGCLIILALLWLFCGDGPQEFVGLPDYVEEEEEILVPESIIVPRTPNISFDEIDSGPVISQPTGKESNGERITRRVMEKLFNKPFIRIRPDFLKNPETGRNMELDGYNEELKIAFEYNGMQHYHFPTRFAKTELEFKNQLRRDKYKLDKCNELGIYLIIVPYSVSHNNILHDIWYKIHPDIRSKTIYG